MIASYVEPVPVTLKKDIADYYCKMLLLKEPKDITFYTENYDCRYFGKDQGTVSGTICFQFKFDNNSKTKEQIAKIYEENFYDGD